VLQARALTLDARRSASRYDDFLFVLDHMLASGAADRASGLPARDELAGSPHRDRGFPRPVLAVMMALAKNWGFVELLKSPVVDSTLAAPFVRAYFPAAIQQRFADRLEAHPLRREIAATAMVNHVVNQAGISVIPRLMVAIDQDPGAIVAAYLTAEAACGAVALRQQVLGTRGPADREHDALLTIEEAIETATRALLGSGVAPPSTGLDELRASLAPS
jgi:glutamate dehydrogenase